MVGMIEDDNRIESLQIDDLLGIYPSNVRNEFKEEEYHANELLKLIYEENIGEIMSLDDELKNAGIDPATVKREVIKEIEQTEFTEESKTEVDDLETELNEVDSENEIEAKKISVDDTNDELTEKGKEALVKEILPEAEQEEVEQEDPIEIPLEVKDKERVMNDLKQIDIRAASVQKKLDAIIENMKTINNLCLDLGGISNAVDSVLTHTLKTIKFLSNIKIDEIK